MLPDGWRQVQRVLVVQADPFDDGSALHPALNLLHSACANAKVAILVAPDTQPNLHLLPWIDEVLVHPAVKLGKDYGSGWVTSEGLSLVEQLRNRHFDAAIVFTAPAQSPYPLAYLCYLAGIPLRVGQSCEFGGKVLSHWVKPLSEPTSLTDYHCFLLESVGLTAPSLTGEIEAANR